MLLGVLVKAQSLPTCSEECTHSQGYWKNHHSGKGKCLPDPDCTWPICESTGVTAEQNTICGLPWLTLFNTPPKGSAWFILAHQYIAAQLNLKDGRCSADTVSAVVSVLASAKINLEFCFLNTKPGSDSGMDMISEANWLDAFNNGNLGPQVCFGDDDNGTGDDDDDTNDDGDDGMGQICGEKVCEIVEICHFENAPTCIGNDGGNGGESECCTCLDIDDRSFEDGCCTRTRGYWRNHNSVKCPGGNNADCIADGWTWADDSEDNVICAGADEVKWIDVFGLDNSAGCNGTGNAWNQLAAQWVAAKLNEIHNQACLTADVANALVQANLILEDNCKCIDPSSALGSVANDFKDVLDEYNNGIRGPGHCGVKKLFFLFSFYFFFLTYISIIGLRMSRLCSSFKINTFFLVKKIKPCLLKI